MPHQLTLGELQQLRAELIERREIHADSCYLRQIRSYLQDQQLPVEFSPSAAGIRITFQPRGIRIRGNP